MTEALTWRQRWAILRQVAAVLVKGGDVLHRVAVAAGVVAAPQEGAPPASAHSAISAIFAAALRDKTWIQAAAMAARADQLLQSGDLLVRVVADHGRNVRDDVRLGVDVTTVLAPRLAAQLVGFLNGPVGAISINIFAFWLNGLLTGKPVQPGDPAYRMPEGAGGLSGA